MKHIYEIAQIKLKDVPGVDEKNVSEKRNSMRITAADHLISLQMCKTIAGTAKSMGIRIVR